MKLKTLKDLGEPRIFGIDDPNRKQKLKERIITDTEIKQEAIKWVKKLKIFHKNKIDCNEVSWIKYFFNITEEDLSK